MEKPVDGEQHLKDVRQLTFGGENAGPISVRWDEVDLPGPYREGACDQQYVLDLATGDSKSCRAARVEQTCGYFSYPKGDRIIYASTEAAIGDCPPPDRSTGYVWPIYPS